MKNNSITTAIEQEIMLWINEKLFCRGLLPQELYEGAKQRIVDEPEQAKTAAGEIGNGHL